MVGIYYAAVTALSPLVGDDVRFIADMDTFGNGGRSTFATALWRFMLYMRQMDNARIDNLLAFTALNAFPRWVTGLVAGACAAAVVSLGSRLAGRVTPLSQVIMAACLMVLMPWREEGLSTVKCFNILIPSAFTLGFLRILTGKGKLRAWQLVAGALFAIIAGGIHEAFSVSALAGTIIYGAGKRRYASARFLWIAGGYAVGILWVVTAPGIIMRAGHSGAATISLFALFTMVMPLLLLAAAMGWAAVFQRTRLRQWTSWPLFLPLAGSLAASIAIVSVSAADSPRGWWIPDLYASVMLAALIMCTSPARSRAIAATLSALLILFGAGVARAQYASYMRHRALREAIDASPAGTVFAAYSTSSPKYLLLHPVTNVWHSSLHLLCANYCRTDRRIEAVVAPALGHITVDEARAVNAQRDPGGEFRAIGSNEPLWEYRGEIVAPDRRICLRHWSGETLRTPVETAEARYEWPGNSRVPLTMPVHLQRFVTSGGDTLIWLRPLRHVPAGPYLRITLNRNSDR